VIARGFMLDLAGLIEQNRRRSMATSRILRLKPGQRRREDGMRDWNVYFRTSSNRDGFAKNRLPDANRGPGGREKMIAEITLYLIRFM